VWTTSSSVYKEETKTVESNLLTQVAHLYLHIRIDSSISGQWPHITKPQSHSGHMRTQFSTSIPGKHTKTGNLKNLLMELKDINLFFSHSSTYHET